MNLNRIINLVTILVGGVITLYAQAGEDQNNYLLIAGIVLLLFGIYRTSRGIPSKYDQASNDESFIKNEDEN